jgi:hypothetical protein
MYVLEPTPTNAQRIISAATTPKAASQRGFGNLAETLGADFSLSRVSPILYYSCCHSVVVPIGFRLAVFSAPCLDYVCP